MGRREFLLQVPLILATSGALFPVKQNSPPEKPLFSWKRVEPPLGGAGDSSGYSHWWICDFGVGETHIFPVGLGDVTDATQWRIRCGRTWREMFVGNEADAKTMAERFTLETLQACVRVIEKVTYSLGSDKLTSGVE